MYIYIYIERERYRHMTLLGVLIRWIPSTHPPSHASNHESELSPKSPKP